MSIGGWTAINLAIHRPARIATVTTLDPVNVYGDLPFETVVRSLPAAVKWLPRSWRDSFNSYTAGGKPVEQVPVADMIESGMKNYTIRQPVRFYPAPPMRSTASTPEQIAADLRAFLTAQPSA